MEPSSDIQFIAQMLSKAINQPSSITANDFMRLDEIAVNGHSVVPVNPNAEEAQQS
jgi:hypothetical protein